MVPVLWYPVLVGKIGRFIPFQDFDIVYIQTGQIFIFRYGFYEILHTVGCYGKFAVFVAKPRFCRKRENGRRRRRRTDARKRENGCRRRRTDARKHENEWEAIRTQRYQGILGGCERQSRGVAKVGLSIDEVHNETPYDCIQVSTT